jgi:hypothetical protein
MWGYVLLALAMTVTISTMTRVVTTQTRALSKSEVHAMAGSMAVYRNYVVAYASTSPGASGSVADAALGLPSWYAKQGGIANYVSAAKGYVYVAQPQGNLAYVLAKRLDGSINVGIKQNGYLYSPFSSTNTSIPIALPAAIPDGSVVIAQ